MKRLELQNTNRPCEVIRHWRNAGHLDFNPPYQRGDVWGEMRQRNLIRSIMQGIPIASIIINDRTRRQEWGVLSLESPFLAVIDGKQRMTAVLRFMDGHFSVPGDWFDVGTNWKCFCDLPLAKQRRFQNCPVAFSEGSMGSIEEEQEVFELVNFGGVPQGETDV